MKMQSTNRFTQNSPGVGVPVSSATSYGVTNVVKRRALAVTPSHGPMVLDVRGSISMGRINAEYKSAGEHLLTPSATSVQTLAFWMGATGFRSVGVCALAEKVTTEPFRVLGAEAQAPFDGRAASRLTVFARLAAAAQPAGIVRPMNQIRLGEFFR